STRAPPAYPTRRASDLGKLLQLVVMRRDDRHADIGHVLGDRFDDGGAVAFLEVNADLGMLDQERCQVARQELGNGRQACQYPHRSEEHTSELQSREKLV